MLKLCQATRSSCDVLRKAEVICEAVSLNNLHSVYTLKSCRRVHYGRDLIRSATRPKGKLSASRRRTKGEGAE